MASNARPPDAAAVAVFAKAPVPGTVKTRLSPLLGADEAAALHERLVRHALATAASAGLAELQLWCAPDCGHPFFAQCAAEFGAALHSQAQGDLGERMARAFRFTHGTGRPLVLIGSDCPAITPQVIRAAAKALRDHDAAIAPAEDGGYVLVALSRPLDIFDGIPWGTADVMARTRDALDESDASYVELETLWDIDRPEDYRRLMQDAGWMAETP